MKKTIKLWLALSSFMMFIPLSGFCHGCGEEAYINARSPEQKLADDVKLAAYTLIATEIHPYLISSHTRKESPYYGELRFQQIPENHIHHQFDVAVSKNIMDGKINLIYKSIKNEESMRAIMAELEAKGFKQIPKSFMSSDYYHARLKNEESGIMVFISKIGVE